MKTIYYKTLLNLLKLGSLPKLGLERIILLLNYLNNPQKMYNVFHIGGTNGKGSTSVFLESILRSAGYKTGLYTSPHLCSVRERLQVDRIIIKDSDFAKLGIKIPVFGTFFERLTAMTFFYFAKQRVDVAIIEVGLGGRLDATNVSMPIVSGISRIDIDHSHVLGNSFKSIVIEKAGIFKHGIPACWSAQSKKTKDFLDFYFLNRNISIDNYIFNIFNLDGLYQKTNCNLALNMMKLSKLLTKGQISKLGAMSLEWACRYETILQNPLVLLDGAHNPAGTRALINCIGKDSRFLNKKISLFVGLTIGHSASKIAKVWFDFLPTIVIYTGVSMSARAVPAAVVAEHFLNAGFLKVVNNASLEQVISESEAVIVTGSLYWSGYIRSQLVTMPVDKFIPNY